MDDVPAYVIRNTRGNEKVLHRVRLLLWSSKEDEVDGLQMTVAPLAIPKVSGSELEPLPSGGERSKVPYEWSFNGFGLNLASLDPTIEVPVTKTGHEALAT